MTNPAPDQIKAVATTAQLLAAVEPFELSGCAFGMVSTSYVRAMGRDMHAETFRYGPATFSTESLPAVLMILMPMARPSPDNLDVPTLRPFAEMLVRYGVRKARLVSPAQWTAWVEVTKDGVDWRRVPADFLTVPALTPTPEETPAIEVNDDGP